MLFMSWLCNWNGNWGIGLLIFLIDSCRCCCFCQIWMEIRYWVVDILIDSCRCCCCCQNWMEIRLLGCWYFRFLTSAEKIVQHSINSQFISRRFPRTLNAGSWLCGDGILWVLTYLLAYYRSFECLPLCLSTK